MINARNKSGCSPNKQRRAGGGTGGLTQRTASALELAAGSCDQRLQPNTQAGAAQEGQLAEDEGQGISAQLSVAVSVTGLMQSI
jgi:hypothetical protein